MPTYVYACDRCGVQFEKFQSFKEEPIQVCPECGASNVRRVFQPVGIVFKGSGWYITDSRNSSSSAVTNTSSSKSNSDTTPSSKNDSTNETTNTTGSSSETPTTNNSTTNTTTSSD